MAGSVVKKSITAQNTFSDAFDAANELFNVSIWTDSAFVATVTLQRRIRGEADTDWRDVSSWTAATEQVVQSVGSWQWRIGVKTGGFTSGTVKVSLVN